MAKLTGNIQFTGSLGDVSAYTRRGSDQIIVRRKGGGSKETIKNRDSCVNIRRINMEFGGRSSACKVLKNAMHPVSLLTDFNVSAGLNTVVTVIQKLDTAGDWGERAVLFSKQRSLLEGYQLNRRYSFDSIVRSPIIYAIDKAGFSASVVLPDLLPGINLNCPWKVSLFRFVVSLGPVPDMSLQGDKYMPVKPLAYKWPVHTETAWQPVTLPFTGSTIIVKPGKDLPESDGSHSLILSIGIECGNWITNELAQTVKYTGCGKVLAMV